MSILKSMKGILGSKAFTAGIREALIERKQTVKQYFKREETTFEGSSDGEVVNREELFILMPLT